MNDNIIFSKDKWLFKLEIPEYETPIFGAKMAEVRLISQPETASYSMDNIKEYLDLNEILACTFRGKEITVLVQYLNNLGFRFIGTFNTLYCRNEQFTRITVNSGMKVIKAEPKDYDKLLDIESKVFDYSSYQLDPLFSNEIAAYRNALRVKSYLGNANHVAYVVKHEKSIIGFLQFIIDSGKRIAKCVNGAVIPDHHGHFVGPKLYSDAFQYIFASGVYSITSGCSNQNTSAYKIHSACGFRITEQEIHLRLVI